jgi:hypothetical protein
MNLQHSAGTLDERALHAQYHEANVLAVNPA